MDVGRPSGAVTAWIWNQVAESCFSPSPYFQVQLIIRDFGSPVSHTTMFFQNSGIFKYQSSILLQWLALTEMLKPRPLLSHQGVAVTSSIWISGDVSHLPACLRLAADSNSLTSTLVHICGIRAESTISTDSFFYGLQVRSFSTLVTQS